MTSSVFGISALKYLPGKGSFLCVLSDMLANRYIKVKDRIFINKEKDMRVFVAYSRPRGIHGRSIFTIMVYYTYSTEVFDISVTRFETTYSCGHCGMWATITTSASLTATAHQQKGKLELFRYDNVEPGDIIGLFFQDTDLLFNQNTHLTVNQGVPKRKDEFLTKNDRASLPTEPLHEVIIIDWDEYLHESSSMQRELRVEEELINKTMNAEQITIKELLIEPAKQTPAIEGAQRFIEGELRYLS